MCLSGFFDKNRKQKMSILFFTITFEFDFEEKLIVKMFETNKTRLSELIISENYYTDKDETNLHCRVACQNN